MATAVPRLPSHLQTRTKAAATTTSPPPKPPSPANGNRQKYTAAQIAEAVSDKATISLIRRVLCSATADKNATISELLPPLTSSNEVDLQVYGIVAVMMREFVYAWYSKITPDQVFVDEVVKVIAHVTRGLEQRIRKVDLETLLFDEVPELLEAHVTGESRKRYLIFQLKTQALADTVVAPLPTILHGCSAYATNVMRLRENVLTSSVAYRVAHYPLHPSPYEENPRLIYHSLWPHPALSPVPDSVNPSTIALQRENEAAYRDLLVQGLLAVLLPTEDLENNCLTSLVGGILSDMIIGNGIGGKASEPWLLWEGITKIIEVVQEQLSRSKKTGHELESCKDLAEPKEATVPQKVQTKGGWSIQKVFWLVLQYGFLAFTTVRLIIFTIASSSALPTRGKQFVKKSSNISATGHLQPPASPYSTRSFSSQMSTAKQVAKQPIINMKVWPCVSTLVDLGVRIPWLCATLSLLQWGALHGPGHIGGTDGRVDK